MKQMKLEKLKSVLSDFRAQFIIFLLLTMLILFSVYFITQCNLFLLELIDRPDIESVKIGIRGILLNRRNIPIMSMPIESMLLAVNSNFLVFSVSSDDMMGQSFASLVSTVAAAESAIGVRAFLALARRLELIEEKSAKDRVSRAS
ncbi:hypothetical protein AHAS_Ahas02G0144400 [Arachis hypogaea]